jgi:hypothetical protein
MKKSPFTTNAAKMHMNPNNVEENSAGAVGRFV